MSDEQVISTWAKGNTLHIAKEVDGSSTVCGEEFVVDEHDGPVTETKSEFINHLTTSSYVLCSECKVTKITEFKE